MGDAEEDTHADAAEAANAELVQEVGGDAESQHTGLGPIQPEARVYR